MDPPCLCCLDAPGDGLRCANGHGMCLECFAQMIKTTACAEDGLLVASVTHPKRPDLVSAPGDMPCLSFPAGECDVARLPYRTVMAALLHDEAALEAYKAAELRVAANRALQERAMHAARETAEAAAAATADAVVEAHTRVIHAIEQGLVRRCPQCRLSGGVKDAACFHVTCRVCGCNWCYACEQPRSVCRDECGAIQGNYLHQHRGWGGFGSDRESPGDGAVAELHRRLVAFRVRAVYDTLSAAVRAQLAQQYPDLLQNVLPGRSVTWDEVAVAVEPMFGGRKDRLQGITWEAGDRVRLLADQDLVRRQCEGYTEWQDAVMQPLLGQVGTVVAALPPPGAVTVTIHDTTIACNPRSLVRAGPGGHGTPMMMPPFDHFVGFGDLLRHPARRAPQMHRQQLQQPQQQLQQPQQQLQHPVPVPEVIFDPFMAAFPDTFHPARGAPQMPPPQQQQQQQQPMPDFDFEEVFIPDAGLRPALRNPTGRYCHEWHPLVGQLRNNATITCNRCRAQVLGPWTYSCGECTFNVCEPCIMRMTPRQPPPQQRQPVQRQHLYVRRPTRPVPTCPQSHALEVFHTPHAGFACDQCNSSNLAAGTVMHGCRACNYDLCVACYHRPRQPVPPLLAPTRLVCPAQHALSYFLSPIAGYSCDGCNATELPAGAPLFSCRTCNYDLCQQCAARSRPPQMPPPQLPTRRRFLPGEPLEDPAYPGHGNEFSSNFAI